MALSDAPEIDPTPAYHRRGCALGRWARTLPEADRQVLLAWLSDPSVPHSAIAERITDDPDYEIVIISSTVSRHRAGKCSCGAL